MIGGIGVDIVEISRLKKAIQKWQDSFLKRIFTDNEINYSRQKKFTYQHLAARFAAKEAVLKALGTDWIYRLEWKNVEILNDEFGKPVVNLNGAAKKMKQKEGISDIIISMSHTHSYAVANAVLIKKE